MILTLALGIGATVAIFSVVNAVLLRDLPYPHADRLVALRTLTPDGMSLLTAFGIVALVLATVGIYGLMSYSVAQRTGEIAVRAALDASAGQVLSLILRRGAQLGVAGIAIGVAAAIVLRRIVASQLYEVSTLDLSVFVLVPLTLFAVALLASYVPARRASKVDPAVVLRGE